MVRLEVVPADRWAARVADDLAGAIRNRPTLRLCLPTGDTPAPVYARFVERAAAQAVDVSGVEIVLLDEYVGLSPSDPARCDGRLRRELLDRLAPGPAAFHPVLVDELDPEAAAAMHDAVAARGLDLAILGLGANGHIGFNEPGSTADSPTRVVSLARETARTATGRYGAVHAPVAGITLGLGRLLDAAEVWLLVTGARKAGVLRRALEGPEGPDCPASYLRRHPSLRVIADAPAVARLGRSS